MPCLPRTKGFTAPYFEWNTFTSLDLPLIDFGRLLLVPIFSLIGLLVGITWGAARRLRAVGGIAYSLAAAGLVTGYSTFLFTAPQIVGSLFISLGCFGVVSLWRRSAGGSKADVVDPEDSLNIGG